jgi:hypothetical protein
MTLVYVERMVGTTSMVRCDSCFKLIRWPEEARIYAPSVNDKPSAIEHLAHPVRKGATKAQED